MSARPALCALTAALLVAAFFVPTTRAQDEPAYEPQPKGSVTWVEVAPIVYSYCTPCHRPGEGAPFPLLTYQEARRRARLLGMVIQDGFMPPLLPTTATPPLVNVQRMTVEDKGMLIQWSRERAPKGDEALHPAPPEFSADGPRGAPDLVVQSTSSFEMPADEINITRNFVFPLTLDQDRWVEAISFRPSSKAALRALLFVVPAGTTADLAPDDLAVVLEAEPTVEFLPVGGLGGEIVETSAWPYPDGTALTLPSDSNLLLQVYFEPTGEVETERPTLGLYFADQAPSRKLVTVSLGTRTIDLPPEEQTTIRSTFELPIATTAVGVIPQAHRLATQLRGWATLPDGSKLTLVDIDQWNFRWQTPYWYERPIDLPAGTVLEMEYVYDNTEENENNTWFPPRETRWGQTLAGEMAGLHVKLVLSGKKKDSKKLAKAYREYGAGM